MERVVCQVDESRAAVEAVRAAIAYCTEHAAELELVGVVRDGALGPPQPAVGERIRRFKAVQYELPLGLTSDALRFERKDEA